MQQTQTADIFLPACLISQWPVQTLSALHSGQLHTSTFCRFLDSPVFERWFAAEFLCFIIFKAWVCRTSWNICPFLMATLYRRVGDAVKMDVETTTKCFQKCILMYRTVTLWLVVKQNKNKVHFIGCSDVPSSERSRFHILVKNVPKSKLHVDEDGFLRKPV